LVGFSTFMPLVVRRPITKTEKQKHWIGLALALGIWPCHRFISDDTKIRPAKIHFLKGILCACV
jgi:hypothetical protein